MADIRSCVHSFLDDTHLPQELRVLAWNMFRQDIAEQKLAAILILQEHLLPNNELVASRDLSEIAVLFQQDYIRDWNTTDWLCVRVLGPLIEQDNEDGNTARTISDWVKDPSNSLWQRRAALVSFVNLASKKESLYTDVILKTAEILVQDDARFAQTGVGWVLRSLSNVHAERVFDFLKDNKEYVSKECMKMATARLSDTKRKALGVTGKRKRR